MNALVRALLVIALLIGVLGFGAIGLCGGGYTLMAVVGLLTEGNAGIASLLVLSVPCGLGGFLMVRLCAKQINTLLRRGPAHGDAP